MGKFQLLVLSCLLSLSAVVTTVQAQRFLRDGFTSKLDEEFKYEAGLDTVSGPVGMPREMFVLTELDLELVPKSNNNNNTPWKIPNNRELTRHLNKYLKRPLKLQLEQRKGGIGYRAFGITPQGQRLRGSWRRAEAPQKLLNSDFLKVSYDEAVRSRLMFVEIEMLLPRLPKRMAAAAAAAATPSRGTSSSSSSNDGDVTTAKVTMPTTSTATKRSKPPIPRVVYQFALEGGVMNPKAVVPRGDCVVRVMYDGNDSSSSNNNKNTPIGPPLCAKIGMSVKSGLVDPGWARGRTILRQGRSVGVV